MNVFINCPLDETYVPLFRPLVFTLLYFGLHPVSATQDTDSSSNRLEKIIVLMKNSEIGIHDLSRIKSSKAGEYSRMNMPFELGIDYCLKRLVDGCHGMILVLEDEPYSYQKGLSDYAGFDILSHKGEPTKIVKVVRDWLVNNGIVDPDDAKGSTAIWYEYNDCWSFIYDELVAKGYSPADTDDIPYNEFRSYVEQWIANKKK